MNRAAAILLASSCSLVTAYAAAQTTQGQAFNDGKAYKPANASIKNGIDPAAAMSVPGRDPAATGDLTGLYGANLAAPGQSKIATCAAYVPGSDAYRNAECDTVNYVVGNPSARPVYTIDKINDPLVVRSSNIRNMPEANTAGTSGLSGNYTACVNQTTNLPERFDTERCQIGRAVTENQCSATLTVRYTWQPFSNQAGADLRYGHCAAGQVRGDQLSLPITNTYRTELARCADNGHGDGAERKIWHRDCGGAESLHGYDATACTAPPTPAASDPPRAPQLACADAPRTDQNCFSPAGRFAGVVLVPVFEDHWDNGGCADLDLNGAIITK
jgi:hypothetical protein